MNGLGSLAGTTLQNAQLYERLETAHRRYRQLFEDSVDAIILTDRQGRIPVFLLYKLRGSRFVNRHSRLRPGGRKFFGVPALCYSPGPEAVFPGPLVLTAALC